MNRRRATAIALSFAFAVMPVFSCTSDRNGVFTPGGEGCVVPGTAIGPDQAVVFIRNFTFFPDTLRIASGTRVTWINCEEEMEHTSTATGGAWNSGTLAAGESFAHTFSSAGTNGYFCEPHPFMIGAIIVE